MHSGLWETIADALLWLQLCWVFSGFVLMAYLAFKVFPSPEQSVHPDAIGNCKTGLGNLHDAGSTISYQLMSSLNSSVGSLQSPAAAGNVIKFRTTISQQKRRQG